MKIYDISQEVFSCSVYPGDPAPKREVVASIAQGNTYNLTAFSMCAHNGTHIDAPSHFIEKGKSISEIPLDKTVGMAFVAIQQGEIYAAEAENIISAAKELNPEAAKRILLKGDCTVTAQGAEAFARNGVCLIGVESQTVGDANAPMEVHKILLGAEVVLLEGIRLDGIEQGVYFLSAQPLNLANSDGAPTRAILIDFN